MAASVINLTLPIAPDMPVGQTWAHDVPFQMEPIRTYAAGGAQLEYYQFHTDTGTRLVTCARHNAAAGGIGALDFATMVDLRTAIVDVPAGAGACITPAALDEAVTRHGAFGRGEALLVRTGWGSAQRCREMGERFVLESPHLSVEAAGRLAALLRERASPLLAIDTPCLVDNGGRHAQREWTVLPPWQRPPWPSDIARAYLRHYTPERQRADWGGDQVVLDACPVLLALGNTSGLHGAHVRLTALPFFCEDAPAAPATVIAKVV